MRDEDEDMPIDLTAYSEAIATASKESTFSVVATNGADGPPDIGPKGSVFVFDRDHLAYWERARGQHLTNLRHDPHVAVLYLSRERRMYLRLFGEATLYETGPEREQIMGRVAELTPGELEFDPDRRGIGVLIRVDRLVEAFSGVSQQRAAAGAPESEA
jgi:hypothetical protein